MDVAGLQVGDVSHAVTERRIRLGDHLPGASETVEVVHVGGAQIGLQGIEQPGERHALGLGPFTIHFRIQLRHIGLVAGDRETHARCLGDRILECIHRVLQLAIAQVAAILDEHLVTIAITQSENRRRHKGEGKTFLEAGDAPVDFFIDLRGSPAALIKGLQREEHQASIGCVGELQGVEPGEGHRVGYAFGLHADIHHPLQQLVRALQRRPFRQFYPGDQIHLVLGGNKARRHHLEHQPGARQQQRIDHEHHAAVAQGTGHTTLIALRTGVEEAIERPEQPAKQGIDDFGQAILRRAMRLEQHGCQRRRQGQRIDRGNHRGNGDGHCKLPVELPGNPIQKCHGHKHRTQHQADSHNGAGHFLHGLVGSGQGRQPFLDIPLHVFHHHDGIVHHNTDGQHQPEQGQGVDGIAEQIERRECPDDGNGHRQQGNDGRPPGLQEQGHHEHDKQYRLQQGLDD